MQSLSAAMQRGNEQGLEPGMVIKEKNNEERKTTVIHTAGSDADGVRRGLFFVCWYP